MPAPFPITEEQKRKFVECLAETGNISASAKFGGFSRSGAYEVRAIDEAFKAAWDEAHETYVDKMESDAARRAFEGYDSPIYFQGVLVGTARKYSDTLAVLLLKGNRKAKYSERHEITGADGSPFGSNISREELSKLDDSELARQIQALVAGDKSK